MNDTLPRSRAVLILPHVRIQNANAISSPLTHGFPAVTAFLGLMWALERRLGRESPIEFHGVGVICHGFDEQTTGDGFVRKFRLTRNPVDKNGETTAIVEEGRIHLDVTLVFAVDGSIVEAPEAGQQTVAERVADTVTQMRIAGGSVLPGESTSRRWRPSLVCLADSFADRQAQFRKLRRRWLPGFALVSRDDLLAARTAALRAGKSDATALDALLDLSRFNWRSSRCETTDETTGNVKLAIEWGHDRDEGWLVPIPVGYGALSDLYPSGSVANARDGTTPFRFVESLYSVGQWLGPHRLDDIAQLIWYARHDPGSGLYRCHNDYATSANSHE